MSWINGLLVGVGEGLRRGSSTYFEAKARQRQQQLQDEELVDRRMAAVQRGMLDRDELDERKRSNKAQEALEHERNVSGSMERMLARENATAARDAATRRAIEVALINAERARSTNAASNASREKVAGMPARPRGGAGSNADALTQTQRDGLMLINRDWLPGEQQEKAEMEKLYRQARAAFPNAHPGDVAMAAKRLYDRMNRDRKDRY